MTHGGWSRGGSRSSWAAALALVVITLTSCEPRSHEQTLRSVADRWVRAWNDRDLTALMALFDRDISLRWPSMEQPLFGKDAAARQISLLWSGWSGFELHRNAVFVEPRRDTVAIEWVLIGTATTGKPVRLEGFEILRVRDRLITVDRGIFDTCNLIRQLK
jgi:hypothetical protein